jgi:hypothetical protein
LNINILTGEIGMSAILGVPVVALSGWLSGGAGVLAALLLALAAYLAARWRDAVRQVRAREAQLAGLTVELEFKEALYEKACAIISDVEKTARRLPDAFDEFGRMLKLPYAAYVLRDANTGQMLDHQYPVARLDAGRLAERLLSLPSEADGAPATPFRPSAGWESGLTLDEGTDVFQSVLICPIVRSGEMIGGILLALPEAELSRREKDLGKIAKILEALFTYRTLQNELARRAEEADTVSSFLTELAVFAALDKIMEAFHRFIQDAYPRANVSMLLEEPDGGVAVRHGTMLEAPVILTLLPSARQELEKGKQLLYAPDAFGLLKRYALPATPKHVESVAVVPLVTFKHIYGYVVIESTERQLFNAASLSTLLRLVEMGSFVLRKTLFYQGEIDKLAAEVTRLQQEEARQSIHVSELEMALREATEFNTVFTVAQAIRVHLSSLRGFVQMLEDGVRQRTPGLYDPLLFRNCAVEIEKVERSLQKLELTRVITDRDYPFRIQPVDLMAALDRVFVELRSKAVAKSIEIEVRLDARLGRTMLDEELTTLGLRLFLDRLMDFVAGGKLQAVGLVREHEASELLVRFTAGAAGRPVREKLAAFNVARDFHFVLLNRMIARQRGQLDFELAESGGFLLRLVFPYPEPPA